MGQDAAATSRSSTGGMAVVIITYYPRKYFIKKVPPACATTVATARLQLFTDRRVHVSKACSSVYHSVCLKPTTTPCAVIALGPFRLASHENGAYVRCCWRPGCCFGRAISMLAAAIVLALTVPLSSSSSNALWPKSSSPMDWRLPRLPRFGGFSF